jgi:DNA-binding response OmpR family regulator
MSSVEILIIDDDEMILHLAQSVLEQGGFDVITTSDGPHGIELYKARRPDLVLLDLGLPTLDGRIVLAKIREIDPRARVIIVTGYASERTTEESMNLGAMDFLTKPFSPQILLEKVRLAVAV